MNSIREMILSGLLESIVEMQTTAVDELVTTLGDVERALVQFGTKPHFARVAVKVDGIVDLDAIESNSPLTPERLARYYSAIHAYNPERGDEVHIVLENQDVVDIDAWESANLSIVVTTEDVVVNEPVVSP